MILLEFELKEFVEEWESMDVMGECSLHNALDVLLLFFLVVDVGEPQELKKDLSPGPVALHLLEAVAAAVEGQKSSIVHRLLKLREQEGFSQSTFSFEQEDVILSFFDVGGLFMEESLLVLSADEGLSFSELCGIFEQSFG